MKTETIEIVERGRGPQLSTTRITVMDIFYWLHRSYGADEILEIMPSLSRAEFDVVMDYVNQHRDELAERDRRTEEFHQKAMAEQHARGGIFAPPDESIPREVRMERLRAKLRQRIAEKNGEGHSG